MTNDFLSYCHFQISTVILCKKRRTKENRKISSALPWRSPQERTPMDLPWAVEAHKARRHRSHAHWIFGSATYIDDRSVERQNAGEKKCISTKWNIDVHRWGENYDYDVEILSVKHELDDLVHTFLSVKRWEDQNMNLRHLLIKSINVITVRILNKFNSCTCLLL